MKIGGIVIPCAVLEDGRRVLSEFGITRALGSRSGASKRRKKAEQEGGALLHLALCFSGVTDRPLAPIRYYGGKTTAIGYVAELLPSICEVWLSARDAGKLRGQQLPKAKKAEILMRALANVGIIALVDEATGYQDFRARRDRIGSVVAYLRS